MPQSLWCDGQHQPLPNSPQKLTISPDGDIHIDVLLCYWQGFQHYFLNGASMKHICKILGIMLPLTHKNHSLRTSTKFSAFFTPSPLSTFLPDIYVVVKSHNLPYSICFWGNPPPPCCEHPLSMVPYWPEDRSTRFMLPSPRICLPLPTRAYSMDAPLAWKG